LPIPSTDVLKSTSTAIGGFFARNSSTVAAAAGSAWNAIVADDVSPEPLGLVIETSPGITLGVLLKI
jgi:hypothetical protein